MITHYFPDPEVFLIRLCFGMCHGLSHLLLNENGRGTVSNLVLSRVPCVEGTARGGYTKKRLRTRLGQEILRPSTVFWIGVEPTIRLGVRKRTCKEGFLDTEKRRITIPVRAPDRHANKIPVTISRVQARYPEQQFWKTLCLA